ncbi:retropepsin-like aspartic protease [Microscilla marina]|uniref:PDZ domain-containing protein n=1 Tax=Microscilla marina ATCC 23134 TaxID=313606 RepID=A1ZEA8_MICM2|nr:retropepsin-like aspartic protease [Microscilla marina]EAY31416.1 hypothetical protein M23134_04249 [Microscilla marina ATCC 23134]
MRYFIFVWIMGCCGASCTPKAFRMIRKAKVQTSDFTQQLPYVNTKRMIVVKATLNNQRTYRFIWDTGAGVTVLSRKVVQELGLKPRAKMKVGDSRKRRKTLELVNIQNFTLGGVKFKNIAGLVVDYDSTSVLPCIAEGGIIGTNIIARCNWTIDYAQQTLIFTNQPYYLQNNPKSFAFKTGSTGRIYFDMQIKGKTIRNVLFDSGSSGGLDLRVSDGLKAGWLKRMPSTKLLDGTTQGLYGTRLDTTYVLTLDSVKVGSLPPLKVPVELGRYVNKKIGNRIMQSFQVKIDYPHKRLLWIPTAPIALWPSVVGALFKRSKGKLTVGSLYLPSDASAKGVKLNDEVVQINDQPLTNFFTDNCSFYQWFFDVYNIKVLKITLKNGKKISLHKKPLGAKLWWQKQK